MDNALSSPLDDNSLSLKAIGLYAVIKHLQEQHGYATFERIRDRQNGGTSGVISGLKFLIDKGYLIRYRLCDERGQVLHNLMLAMPEAITVENWFRYACHNAALVEHPRFIYVIGDVDGRDAKHSIKIGMSNNPKARLATLQNTTKNTNLKIICQSLVSTPAYIEALLHNAYRHFNTTGEWFSISGSEILTIAEKLRQIQIRVID